VTANRFAVGCLFGSMVLTGIACFGASGQDLNATREAVMLSDGAYNRIDGGPARALIRAAACAEVGVLRRNKITVDAGVGAECP